MSAAKHTPGPWMWNCNTLMPVNGDPATSAVHSILDAGGGYGYLGSATKDTTAELDADRLLIAAAPDLLAALQALRDGGGFIHLLDRDQEVIEAAITKATGVSS